MWKSRYQRSSQPDQQASIQEKSGRLRDAGERWSRKVHPHHFEGGQRLHLEVTFIPQSVDGEARLFDPAREYALRSVLIVEDDDYGRETLTRILVATGYHVLGAANGDEALHHLYHDPRPDLMILDLILPKLDGWQLMETQESDPTLAGIPVIVVSAADTSTLQARSLGIVALFEKPVAVGDLLAAIRQQLQG